MKGGTLQITWHGSDPVLTLDFHRLSGLLATGGADHDIKFWTLHQVADTPLPSATFHSNLSHHTAAVNVVRFSSTGDQLASGADGGEILLWKLTESLEASNMWKLAKNLRFHVKDVLDLQWSFDGTFLVSGSVDNTVIIWDIVKGSPQQVLKDHMHYVQGVAWDPTGQYIASISGDRTCRIYGNKRQNSRGKSQDRNDFSCQSILVKAEVPKQEDEASKAAAVKLNLFHDETLPSFFRRLEWSPDGSFLLVPAGIHKSSSESVMTNTAFIVSRKDLSRPAVQLPGASKPIVAVRFCPIMFSSHPNTEQKSDKELNDTVVFKLPYRLVFAVATLNSLFVYDTQSAHPLAVLAGIHYAAITDIAWSWDGKFLAVSSQDGFCTVVAFDQEELGCPFPVNELPLYVAKFLPPAKDKVLRARSSEAVTKVKSKGDCPGITGKKTDGQPDSDAKALQCHDQPSDKATNPQYNKEEERGLLKSTDEVADLKEAGVLEDQSQEAFRCSELGIQVSTKDSGSQHPDCMNEISGKDHWISNMVKNESLQSCPKKPRRIAPVAVTVNSGVLPAQDTSGTSCSLVNTTQDELSLLSQHGNHIYKDHSLVSITKNRIESSAEHPRRVTPMWDGTPLQENQEANVCAVHASMTEDKLHTKSQQGNCTQDFRNNIASNTFKSECLEMSPKKPRRITPVAIAMNSGPPPST